MHKLAKTKADLSYRSMSNLNNQGVSVELLERECKKRGWHILPDKDRVWIAKTEAALTEIPGGTPDYFQPEEITNADTVYEGAKQSVVVNRYERDRRARERSIQRWGYDCSVCNERLEEKYGDLGKGYIHIHHLKPLGEIRVGYELDPINDLRPVCPNCHAMLHRRTPALSIEELADIVRERNPKTTK